MTAREILEWAYAADLMPVSLHGRTQHKTLHARISVDIRTRGESSLFYRAARGVFFLNQLRALPSLSERHQQGIYAVPRYRELNRNPVLCVRQEVVNNIT